jgi:hypothetical protein
LDSTNLILDGTNSFCPYNLLPINCINERGLLVTKNSNIWVNLEQSAVSVKRESFIIRLSEKLDSLEIGYKEINSYFDALDLRKKYSENYSNLVDFITEKGFSLIDSIKIENYHNLEESFNLKCQVRYEAESINDKIYISPFLNEPISENPFKQTSRSYPIDMEYKRNRQFYSEIEIPAGYKAEYLPTDKQTAGKLVQYEYKVVKLSTNKIAVIGSYNFNQAVYQAEDYLKLKFYYNDIIKIFNDKIVLVKDIPVE